RAVRDRRRADDLALRRDAPDWRDELLPQADRMAARAGVRAAPADRHARSAAGGRRGRTRRGGARVSTRSRAHPGGARVLDIGDCWDRGTATFMMLGDTCTRRCGFCNVKTGRPGPPDPLEPLRVAQSVKRMGLRHAVITSVDRDDLPDLGSTAFVGVIRSIRRFAPGCAVEVLTPDFRGEEMPLARVIAERPDVFNHNV